MIVIPHERPAADFWFAFGHERTAPRSVRAVLQPLFAKADPFGMDVTMVASELVSNVIDHTEDGGELKAWFGPSTWRIEVTDGGGSDWPVAQLAGDGVHGLEIVAALASRWGVESTDGDGRCVWVEFGAEHM